MPEEPKTSSVVPTENIAQMAARSPAIREMLTPITGRHSWVNDKKIRRLYMQASSQQWFAPKRLDFDQKMELDETQRKALVSLNQTFYTLEKMGLNVIETMVPKAVNRLKSEEAAFYLSVQAFDEARHVFAVETYLKKLGQPPRYDRKLHVLGQVASLGIYRVENWLFSTLFSENFASAFLRRTKAANVDPLGTEMCKNLLVDESRHLHFLHIVLPDILDRLSLLGRTYVKASQYFIMKFTAKTSAALDKAAHTVGINRKELIEEVFDHVQRSYEGFGIHRKFVPVPKLSKIMQH